MPWRVLKSGNYPLDRLFYSLVVGIGFVSSAVILTALYLLTVSVDAFATERGNHKLSGALNDLTSDLVALVAEAALQEQAVLALADQNDNASLTYPTPALHDNPTLDWIAIVDADANLIGGSNLPESWDAADYLGGPAFRVLLGQITENNQPAQGGAFAGTNTPFLAALAPISTTWRTDENLGTQPTLIIGRNLDADALGDLATHIGGRNVFFSTGEDERSVAVNGPLGAVGHLSWQGGLPGAHFRQVALPWVLITCASLLLMTAWMGAYFRSLLNRHEKMQKVATTDQLTGVANRTALTDALNSPSMKKAMENGTLAVISLDIDDLKLLNDAHGHHAGDIALKVAAARIAAQVRKSETVFRMGGDEFMCLVIDQAPAVAASKVVERLRTAFSAPMDFGTFRKVVTPSIGVAIANKGEAWNDVLGRSDAAMYLEKRGDHMGRVSA